MLTRKKLINDKKQIKSYLTVRETPTSSASIELEEVGYTILRNIFNKDELEALRKEIIKIYEEKEPDIRHPNKLDYDLRAPFRYEMFNYSPLSQSIVSRREILDIIEPLLGEDCHIIANTCWRNPPGEEGKNGGIWHLDGGPHIPLGPNQVWPEEIPHPVFAIGAHIFLADCTRKCGPTGVIPGSHKSGRYPPLDRELDDDLSWNGTKVKPLLAKTGDVALFVSDIWHRRLPTQRGNKGRFFLQVHYGRRDIAQRIKTTDSVNHLEPKAIERIDSERERLLFGLHPMSFYDG